MTQLVGSKSLEDYAPPTSWTEKKQSSARKGLCGHSCPGEGASELLYAKQKSLNYSICLQILND